VCGWVVEVGCGVAISLMTVLSTLCLDHCTLHQTLILTSVTAITRTTTTQFQLIYFHIRIFFTSKGSWQANTNKYIHYTKTSENETELDTYNQSKHLYMSLKCPWRGLCFAKDIQHLCVCHLQLWCTWLHHCFNALLMLKIESFLICLVGTRIQTVSMMEWQFVLPLKNINMK
jgi:hypothetical protein